MKRRRTRKQQAEPPIKAEVRLGTVQNTSLAVDLFATMLRAVEMTEQRIGEERRNGRNQNEIERD
jgi:hypothetical protein